jgi:type I restriction enzyme S subunit
MNGEKKYELRKRIFRCNVDKVYIYSTAPIKKVVASFVIGDIIEDHPRSLWEQCGEFSGLTDVEFFRYYKGSKIGFAIRIEELEKFAEPFDPREVIPNFIPPQSFCYVNKSDDSLIHRGEKR